jgi:hypothetical protein
MKGSVSSLEETEPFCCRQKSGFRKKSGILPMTTKKTMKTMECLAAREKKLKQLKAQLLKAQLQIQMLEARQRKTAQKADMRRQFVLGRYVLAAVAKGDDAAKNILCMCICMLDNDYDRRLFDIFEIEFDEWIVKNVDEWIVKNVIEQRTSERKETGLC